MWPALARHAARSSVVADFLLSGSSSSLARALPGATLTDRSHHWLAAAVPALLALAVAAVFSRALANAYVYDDIPFIVDNGAVEEGLTLRSVAWGLATTHAANWHPLTWWSLEADSQLFGPGPWGFHFTNVFLHAANTALLCWCLWRLTGQVWSSALVAGLFGLHPLHVESVAWASERKDVLSTFFGLLAVGAYARYAHRPRMSTYLAVATAFALSLLAKPMLVTLPVVLLLLDYWPLGRLTGLRDWRRALLEKLPLAALAAGAGLMAYGAQNALGARNDLADLSGRTASAAVAYVTYLVKTIWPARLSAFYPHPPGGTYPTWQVAGAGLLLASATALAIVAARRRPYVTVGWSWYVITLAPVAGLVQVLGGHAMADRYTYVPLIGIFLIVAWGLADAVERGVLRRGVVAAASVAVLAGCAGATWIQEGHWCDATTLWTHALAVNEDNYLAHNNLGVELQRAGRADTALLHYAECLRLKPDYAEGHNNAGQLLQRAGRLRDAEEHYRRAIDCQPRFAEPHVNLAQLLGQQGCWHEAARVGAEAVRLDPTSARARRNLATALLQARRFPDSPPSRP